MFRATVFDLDDTLIDTQDAWPQVCADFTARHGHRWRAQDSSALHGNGGRGRPTSPTRAPDPSTPPS
jgi:beta-phosphoglucomutase-like phosphatase (HAD superfamily)